MLIGVHALLTYTCTYECDHCFLYCSPSSKGTFTTASMRELIDQAARTEGVTSVCFEGGEPLLYLPALLAAIRYAKQKGFTTGTVTNAYQARSDEDARLLLALLREAGLDSVTVSDDALHFGNQAVSPAKRLTAAAEKAGFPARTISVELPSSRSATGGVMFRGRAVDRMTDGIPRKPAELFDRCPHENPLDPGRVHVDCYGNVHFCQGVVIGNLWKTPLPQLAASWDLAHHPVCGPLAAGGPAELARRFGTDTSGGYVDACHLCFETRRAARVSYPEVLTPPQVYGR